MPGQQWWVYLDTPASSDTANQNADGAPTMFFYSTTPGVDEQQSRNSVVPLYVNDPAPVTYYPDDTVVPKTVEDALQGSIFSQDSGFAPYETLFHDLQLQVDATYNFWEADEENNAPERGVQVLDEVARYVHLKWNQAPDIKDPRAFTKEKLAAPPGARSLYTELSPFGFGARSVVGLTENGVNWVPASLQPENFEKNASSVANGFLAPGVIESVVSVSDSTIQVDPLAPPIDEDEFLAHSDMFEGITYSEYVAAVTRLQSRVYALQYMMSMGTITGSAVIDKRMFFDGKFSVGQMRDGYFEIKGISPTGPGTSMAGATAQSSNTPAVSRIAELATQMGMEDFNHPFDNKQDTQQVKVKFIHTNLQGLVSQDRISSITMPEHAESVTAVAPFIGNLAVYAAAGYSDKNNEFNVPSFPVPASVKPVEYVGYVIEKYEQINGSFSLIETIYIPGREYDEYFDTKVKYGTAYRYRMKSIVRWARPANKDVLGYDPTTAPATVVGLNSITPNRATYFESEWTKEWAKVVVIDTAPPPPPDEFSIRPCSRDGYIEITMKVPYNPQGDISSMTLWRKLQDADGVDITGWVQVKEFSAEMRQGTKLELANEFRYEKDDLTGTRVQVRETQAETPFAEFAPLNSRFMDFIRDDQDNTIYFGRNSNNRYVYAGLCHTRHGECSKLSEQLSTCLNPDWNAGAKAPSREFPVVLVSCAGVDKDFDTGVFSSYPERRLRSEIVVPMDSKSRSFVSFSGQSRRARRPLNNSTYTARLESLDTGEHVDIPVNVQVINMPDEIIQTS